MLTDWLMVGITFIYVVATIAIWFANHKSARATEKQLVESKRQFNETRRLEHMPYMQVYFGKWITNDEWGSIYPDFMLSINRSSDSCAPTSGMSIEITNIGLGVAINLKGKWISGEIKNDLFFSSNIIKQDGSCNSRFIISATYPEEEPQYAESSLIICFNDFLGNHYEQAVEITFEIHCNYITVVQYDTKPPKYIEG